MGDKKQYSTRLDSDLTLELRRLAVDLTKLQNELLDEALRDLLKKYKKKLGKNFIE